MDTLFRKNFDTKPATHNDNEVTLKEHRHGKYFYTFFCTSLTNSIRIFFFICVTYSFIFVYLDMQEKQVRLKLTIIDTVNFSDQIDKSER